MIRPWIDGMVHTRLSAADAERVKQLVVRKRDGRDPEAAPEIIKLYEYDEHTGIYSLPRSQAHLLSADAHDCRTDGRRLDLPPSLFKPREGQQEAIDTLREYVKRAGGGLLQAPCGSGKSKCGAEFVLKWGTTCLVLVHKEFLMNQWVDAFKSLCPSIKIGFCRGDQCDTGWDYDVVIAMTQSIVRREYPQDFWDSFGIQISDEVHRYGAELWQEAIKLSPARIRIGLTAETDRADGTMGIIHHHIGQVGALMVTKQVQCKVHYVFFDLILPQNAYTQPWDGRFSLPRLHTALAEHQPRNERIVHLIRRALTAGRKVLVLSHRKSQLESFAEILQRLGLSEDSIGFYVGGKKQAALDEAAKRRLILGTYQMAQEGLDIPDIDTLFLATPMGRVKQSVGRIVRVHPDKKEPMVVDFVDTGVPPCLGFMKRRDRQYRELGYVVER